MSRRRFLFQWKVPQDGHEWIDGPLVSGDRVGDAPVRVLVPKPAGKTISYDYYQPLRQETALFRQLATLPTDESRILQFADRHGLLSGRDYVLAEGGSYSIEALKISGTQILVRRGDSLDRWLKHILSIRTCITLWEKARAGDQPFLKSVIVLISREEQLEWMSALVRFSSTGVILPAETYFANPLPLKVMGRLGGKRVPLGEPGGIYYAPAAEAEPPASFYTGQRVGFPVTSDVNDDRCIGGFGVTYPAGSIDDQDPVALARALVTTEIMRNLSAGVAPVIEPHPSVAWGELRFVPATLIDAVWLQFAEAVCGDKNFRECLVCGKPFEISPDVARTNKLLCSDSCKMRAYRQRKAKSAELWDQGYSVQEVAGALGSDVKKVAKWLAQHMAGREESVDEIAKQLRVKPAEVRKLLSKKGG